MPRANLKNSLIKLKLMISPDSPTPLTVRNRSTQLTALATVFPPLITQNLLSTTNIIDSSLGIVYCLYLRVLMPIPSGSWVLGYISRTAWAALRQAVVLAIVIGCFIA